MADSEERKRELERMAERLQRGAGTTVTVGNQIQSTGQQNDIDVEDQQQLPEDPQQQGQEEFQQGGAPGPVAGRRHQQQRNSFDDNEQGGDGGGQGPEPIEDDGQMGPGDDGGGGDGVATVQSADAGGYQLESPSVGNASGAPSRPGAPGQQPQQQQAQSQQQQQQDKGAKFGRRHGFAGPASDGQPAAAGGGAAPADKKKGPADRFEQHETIAEIKDIPDLDAEQEERTEEYTRKIELAPNVRAKQVPALLDLDRNIVGQISSMADGLDFSLLTGVLAPPKQVAEPDSMWDYDAVFAQLSSEMQAEGEGDEDGEGGAGATGPAGSGAPGGLGGAKASGAGSPEFKDNKQAA